MASRVEIAPQAFEDLDVIAEYITRRGSVESAERWFNGIIEAIRGLENLPSRCPKAEESEALQSEIRLLLYGKRNRRYKIYFAIYEERKGRSSLPHSALGSEASTRSRAYPIDR